MGMQIIRKFYIAYHYFVDGNINHNSDSMGIFHEIMMGDDGI